MIGSIPHGTGPLRSSRPPSLVCSLGGVITNTVQDRGARCRGSVVPPLPDGDGGVTDRATRGACSAGSGDGLAHYLTGPETAETPPITVSDSCQLIHVGSNQLQNGPLACKKCVPTGSTPLSVPTGSTTSRTSKRQTSSYPRPQWGAPTPPSSAGGPLHPSRTDHVVPTIAVVGSLVM